ncbi:Fic family protein [Baekduia sp. Peel2402]|uniref:Fic family protein n=1 Tax=Baekduia sp. Peel2402 TaxID=3458296 RepID=UPI00403EC329
MDVYSPPTLDAVDLEVLRLIEGLRKEMSWQVAEPRRWYGSLRRMTLAKAVQGSNSVEGYNASLDDVAALIDGEPNLEANEETVLALAGYRDAMTYVLQVAQDSEVMIDEGLMKALHFMMIKHDLPKWPGRWRPGEIFVEEEETGRKVYEGPDSDSVPALIAAMTSQLNRDDGPVLVRAAMAHLNLVMIHPFRDGNGRMARALQTLVLAKERIVAPVFSSIEEYIGRNTKEYYQVLGEVGQGSWHPHNDALPWVRYCLTAHYRQAKTHLRRIEEVQALYTRCAELASLRKVPERTVGPLVETSFGLRLRNSSYRRIVEQTEGEEISDLTASRDLRQLVDSQLVEPHGQNRGRYYTAGEAIKSMWGEVRVSRPPRGEYDPFVVARQNLQLEFDV